jgi:hypothetical protein
MGKVENEKNETIRAIFGNSASFSLSIWSLQNKRGIKDLTDVLVTGFKQFE